MCGSFSGLSLGREISAAASGGIAPLAAVIFSGMTGGQTWPVACLAMGMSLITLIAVASARETYKLNLTEFADSSDNVQNLGKEANSDSFNHSHNTRLG